MLTPSGLESADHYTIYIYESVSRNGWSYYWYIYFQAVYTWQVIFAKFQSFI